MSDTDPAACPDDAVSPNATASSAHPAALAAVTSIQIGSVVTEGDSTVQDALTRRWTSAFRKTSVNGTVEIGPLGIAGDEVADHRAHGGPDKAMLCYSRSHYPFWRSEHPGVDLGPGGFGENLTIEGFDETTVCIGDRFRLGTTEIEVSQPRQPCWKIARRWGIKTMTKQVAQTGRTGWYVRVLQAGQAAPGQTLLRIDQPYPQWTISRLNDLLMGREVNPAALIQLHRLKPLAQSWKDDIA